MIRFIAAVDDQRGIANDHGIPWQGRVPTDVKYYHDNIKTGTILMGYGFYVELSKPYPGGINYVAVRHQIGPLRPGFAPVNDARAFLQNAKNDVWNLGGAQLFASTIDLADELYITQLRANFNCTKFFPPFKDKFQMVSETKPITENGITYSFQVWRRK